MQRWLGGRDASEVPARQRGRGEERGGEERRPQVPVRCRGRRREETPSCLIKSKETRREEGKSGAPAVCIPIPTPAARATKNQWKPDSSFHCNIFEGKHPNLYSPKVWLTSI